MALLGGRYEVLRELGRGGMAEVLLALDRGPAGVKRLVVIKRVLPELAADRGFVSMFLNEARIATHLSHPNIAHIYEVGVEEGQYFLAMEFIHGVDLLGLLRALKQPVRPAHAAHIAARVAAALHHAHNLRDLDDRPLNIVHRDISPQNIRISHEGIVKVLDFGIARASTAPNDTQRGIVRGKFPYMSPEQVRNQEVDGRSDLFALGVVLFEMLTYCRLFKRETASKTLQAVLEDVIPRPSTIVDVPIPLALERIVMQLLRRDPDARYGWAREVEADLEAYLRDDPASSADLEALLREQFGDPASLRAVMDRVIAGEEVEELTATETPSDSMDTVSERVRLMDQAHALASPGVTESGAIVIMDAPVEEPPARQTDSAYLALSPLDGDTPDPGLTPLDGDTPDPGLSPLDGDTPDPGLTPLDDDTAKHDILPGLASLDGDTAEQEALPGPTDDKDDSELQLESGVFQAIQGQVMRERPRATAEIRAPTLHRPHPARSTGTGALWIVGLLLLGGLLGGAGWWWHRHNSEEPPAAEQAAPQQVRIRFVVQPAGAEILVDGVRLVAPELELQASDQDYAVEIRAAGHVPRQLSVRPQRDRTYRIRLKPR